MAKKKREIPQPVLPEEAPINVNESIIQTEGQAHIKDTARSAEREKQNSPFPAEGEINDYGFLHFRRAWLEDLGWSKGMPLKIEKNADGSITLRKA